MTTVTHQQASTAHRREHRRHSALGRPVLFFALLTLAAALLMGVLIAGPMLPMPLMITAACGALGLVALSWTVAGPRL